MSFRISRPPPFHPVLFSIFVILSLFAQNIDKIPFSLTYRPLTIIVITTLLLQAILTLCFRDFQKSALVVSLLMIVVFSYGHVDSFLKPLKIGHYAIGSHVNLLTFFLTVLLFSVYFILHHSHVVRSLTFFANIFATIVLLFTMLPILTYWVSNEGRVITTRALINPPQEVPGHFAPKTAMPSIYYIILDGFGGGDVLNRIYTYDNSPLTRYLEQKGLYVAHKSQSNYNQTAHSLASSLNMQYINYLADIEGRESTRYEPLTALINNNAVSDFLKKRGYVLVSFTSASHLIQRINNADVYIKYKYELNEFEVILLRTSALAGLLRSASIESHRGTILFQFSELGKMAERINDSDRPFFIFAHIFAPHPPFVFDWNGNVVHGEPASFADGQYYIGTFGTREHYIRKYRDQYHFISQKIMETVDGILRKSKSPPIIVIQGDHGPRSRMIYDTLDKETTDELFSIFNAYFLPHGGQQRLYETISPVNTFRVIFNHYFNTQLELLEDRQFVAGHPRIYQFTEIDSH